MIGTTVSNTTSCYGIGTIPPSQLTQLSMNRQVSVRLDLAYVHVRANCPWGCLCPCSAWTWSCSMDTDMQHGHQLATWTSICRMNLEMQHGHEHCRADSRGYTKSCKMNSRGLFAGWCPFFKIHSKRLVNLQLTSRDRIIGPS